ncbi:hypothetical protein [Hymenobacter sp.]|uniref:hypothetical protein n=1 Tax=Hymenobacter sp. TaxID=1898978 RepID=UPI00286A408D|nr:hypothetical protein [Hymenobacter sp.]
MAATTTKTYQINIEGLDTAGQTSKELRAELAALKAQLDTVGTDSAAGQKIQERLGVVRGEIKGLRDEIKSLDPENQIRAFSNFAQGVVGAFGVATVAAEAFGLSSQTAEEFTKKTQGVIAVLGSLDAIRNSLDGETLKSIRTTLAQGQAYLFSGTAATASGTAATAAGRATRLALIATGVGAFLVLVGLVAANWDKVKEVTSGWADKFRPELLALSGFVEDVIAKARDVASFLTGGLVDNAAKAAKAELAQGLREVDQVNAEATTRRIAELQAAGQDTFALRREQLQRELNLLKQQTAEEKKIYLDKESELRVLENQEAKKRADEAEKNRKKQEQAEQAAAGKAKAEREKLAQEAFEAFKKRNQEVEKIQGLSAQDRLRLDLAAEAKRQQDVAALGQQAQAAAGRIAEQFAREQAERVRLAAIPPLGLGDNVLVRVFGVAPDQLDATKAALAGAAQQLAGLAGGLLDAQLQGADERLAQTTQRLAGLDAQAQAAAAASEATAQQLDSAKGARRDFLLGKLEKERAAEARLATERAKAAKEQEQAAKAKAALEQRQQQITAATTAVEAILLGIEAARAIAKAASKGVVGFDNIALAIGATAALVAGFASVKNAAKLEEGGVLKGPSHAQGGIRGTGRFANIEVEGGEGVLPVDATRRNYAAFELLRTAGRTRTLTAADFADAAAVRVLPPAGNRFADGGVLPGGAGAGGVLVPQAELAELVATNKQMLARLDAVAASNQQIAGYGPAVLAIGPGEALRIEEQRQSVRAAEASAAL